MLCSAAVYRDTRSFRSFHPPLDDEYQYHLLRSRSRDITEEPLPAAVPQSPTSARSADMIMATHDRDDDDCVPIPPSRETTGSRGREGGAGVAATETVVEIGPDGEKREWRVGATDVNPSGEVEREWGMGRV